MCPLLQGETVFASDCTNLSDIPHTPARIAGLQGFVESSIAVRDMLTVYRVRTISDEYGPEGSNRPAPEKRPSVTLQGEMWIMLA